MTDVSFRLSGGVTPEYTVEESRALGIQVIPQGIGFQDVPVSNVPSQELDESLNDDTVAIGAFMQFMSQGWEAGKYYARGSTVTNGEWTMVANNLTLDSPFPVPAGNQEFGTDPWTPVTGSELAVVYSGHFYTVNEPVWARTLRVWVPQLTADTNYRVVVIRTNPGKNPVTTILENPILDVGVWTNVALLNSLIAAGTTLLIYVDALNSGADNVVSGGWNYGGQNNTAAPLAQQWNQNNARTLVRIDKTDLDGTDRTAELLGISINSTLLFADTDNPSAFDQYRVTTDPPLDQGTYIEYDVVLQEQGEGGVPIGVTTMTATVPIAQATEYSEEVGAVPVYTIGVTAIGFLQLDGADANGDANKYGVDVEFEGVDASPDWDVLSYNAL